MNKLDQYMMEKPEEELKLNQRYYNILVSGQPPFLIPDGCRSAFNASDSLENHDRIEDKKTHGN